MTKLSVIYVMIYTNTLYTHDKYFINGNMTTDKHTHDSSHNHMLKEELIWPVADAQDVVECAILQQTELLISTIKMLIY